MTRSPHRPSSAPIGGAEGARRIAANGFALLLAYLLPRAFTFGSMVIAARVLGTETFGAYGTAAALAVILSVVATLGMLPLLVREIARDPDAAPRFVRAAHVVKTGFNVLMLLALYGSARWLLGFEGAVLHATMLLGLGYAVGAYAETLGAYFQALERMHVWTQASAAFGLVSGGIGAALVVTTNSLVAFCVGPAVGWTIALMWLAYSAPAGVRRGARLRRGDVAALSRALAPFAAAFVLLTVYYKIDVLLMQRWRPAHDVGVYAAAYKFVDIFQALVIVAAAAVFPSLSRSGAARREGRPWAGARSIEIVLLAALPVGLVLHLAAGPAVTLLFGAAYADARGVVQILGLVLPFLALTIQGGYVLGAAGRMGPVAGLYLGGCAVNIALNRALIPAYGPSGAASAMLLSEIALAVGFLVVLRHSAGGAPGARALAAAAGAAGLGFTMWTVPDPSDGALRAAGYLAAVAYLYPRAGAFPARELALMREAFRPARPAPAASGKAP